MVDDKYFVLDSEESGQVLSKVLEFLLLDPYDQITTTINEGYELFIFIYLYFYNIFIFKYIKELRVFN